MYLNMSALYDTIETCNWQLKVLLKERHALVAKASWSEDDEAYADYLDEMFELISLEIAEAQELL
jgi:hypothetical protein